MIFLDFAQPYQFLFQDSATPMMNGIIDLHHYIMSFLITVLLFVLLGLFFIVKTFILGNKANIIDFSMVSFSNQVLLMDKRNKRQIYQLYYKSKLNYNFNERKLWVFTFWNNFWNNFNFHNKNNLKNQNILLIKSFKIFNLFNMKILELEPRYKAYETDYFNRFAKFKPSPRGKGNKVNLSFFISHNIISNFVVLLFNKKKVKVVKNHIIHNEISSLMSKTYYVLALYFKINDNNSQLPGPLLVKGKLSYGRRYLPERSKKRFLKYLLNYTDLDFSSIFNSYVLNYFNRVQMYIIMKSGLYRFNHNTLIEIIWTILPSIILVFIGIPSFILVYAIDEIIEPDFIIKCIGHQWYWSYEIENENIDEENPYFFEKLFENLEIKENLENLEIKENLENLEIKENLENLENLEIKENLENLEIKEIKEITEKTKDNLYYFYKNFSSYLINENDLTLGKLRLLEVDNPLYIPKNMIVGLIITSDDVLHSWAMPSFGIKCDAVPGRLNYSNLYIERTGTYYGQCSEICGVNHAFMPIVVVGVNTKECDDVEVDFVDKLLDEEWINEINEEMKEHRRQRIEEDRSYTMIDLKYELQEIERSEFLEKIEQYRELEKLGKVDQLEKAKVLKKLSEMLKEIDEIEESLEKKTIENTLTTEEKIFGLQISEEVERFLELLENVEKIKIKELYETKPLVELVAAAIEEDLKKQKMVSDFFNKERTKI
jgi:heme/copper-type cytochrome/quinol oxidase subunit 2